ncbi:nascent polypeptide-associated complex subunit alpha, muscle-specific form-like [Penaeus vannamei]|uniref:nascent polypeptide-associated complex subunit alpha, muscle-specific form-like n=1 Tax=Penaeus vannamei TaxID=6689 RepID=UPI00387F44C6
MWRAAAVALACLLGGLGGAAAGQDGQEKLTWAEVLGVPAPPAPLPTEEYEYEYYYDDDDGEGPAEGAAKDDFFANHDYEYVDTADPSYTPPPPPAEGGEGGGEKTAERRTLDLLYHWFLSDPKKPSRPSLIEEVFRTIDNHIIEDLREWNANAFPHLPKTPGHGAGHDHGARATKGAPAAQEDTLLVTDEQGREHVVTIDDIVTSLGHLDEQTLTELLLGPPAPADKRSSVALPSPPALPQGTSLVPVLVPKPMPAFVLQEKQQQPVLLRALEASPGELARPVRHTGPAKGAPAGPPKAAAALLAEQGDDVFVVQDEQGGVQVVTLQDILASLSALDSGSVNQLLFGEGLGVAPQLPLPSAAGHDAAAAAAVPPAAAHPNAASKKVTPSAAPSPPPTPAPAPTPKPTPPPAAPSVSTDFDGNLHVRARPGSVAVDLRSHDWAARAAGQRQAPAEGGPEGGHVRRDGNGDIHISPAPGRPFALDVHSIIALAEQAEQEAQAARAGAGKSVPSKSTRNRLAGSPAKGGEELPSRGQELLSFLAGVDALPTAIPASPPPTPAPAPTVAPALSHQLLLQALGRPQPTTPAPAPTPSPPASGGLGATLTSFLSRLVGGSTEQPAAPQVAAAAPKPAAPLTPQQEYIQLVLRQQKRHAAENVFGDVVIPLPKPIHHRAPPPAAAAPVKREAVPSGAQAKAAAEEEEEEGPAPLLAGLSPRVLDTLRHQLQDVPHFVPPALRRAAAPSPQPAADARADDVPENEVQRLATSPLESLASYASSFVPSPTPAPSSPSSVPQLLSKLPSESLRKLLLQALQKKSSASAPDPPAVRAPRIPDKPQDRSSYAELPDYSSLGGGYGGGEGYGGGDENPLFDVYFLADATSLYKIGDTNLSLKTPKIGSPKNFVDTRHPYGYHYDYHHHGHHQQSYGHHQPSYGYPATYGYH